MHQFAADMPISDAPSNGNPVAWGRKPACRINAAKEHWTIEPGAIRCSGATEAFAAKSGEQKVSLNPAYSPPDRHEAVPGPVDTALSRPSAPETYSTVR